MALAAGTVAGPIAVTGFVTLDLWWLKTTALGTAAAIKGRYAAYRRWMIRSWALTVGAVMLRLYLQASVLLGIAFMVAYRAITWLAWVPNAVAAEIYLRQRLRPQPGTTWALPDHEAA